MGNILHRRLKISGRCPFIKTAVQTRLCVQNKGTLLYFTRKSCFITNVGMCVHLYTCWYEGLPRVSYNPVFGPWGRCLGPPPPPSTPHPPPPHPPPPPLYPHPPHPTPHPPPPPIPDMDWTGDPSVWPSIPISQPFSSGGLRTSVQCTHKTYCT
jgi:hypothetical protein